MTSEQLCERMTVAGDVSGQQFGVAALLPNLRSQAHGRTVTNRRGCSTSPQRASAVDSTYDAACTVISEISERFLPAVLPSVEIHTSRLDVGDAALTGMLL